MSDTPQLCRYALRSKTSPASPATVTEDEEFDDNAQLIEHLNSIKNRSDPIVSFYFPPETNQDQRDFVWRVLQYYVPLTIKRSFNLPPAQVFNRLDAALKINDNHSEENPFSISFAKVDALSSAIRMITAYRDVIWQEQQHDSIKLHLRIASGHYFPLR